MLSRAEALVSSAKCLEAECHVLGDDWNAAETAVEAAFVTLDSSSRHSSVADADASGLDVRKGPCSRHLATIQILRTRLALASAAGTCDPSTIPALVTSVIPASGNRPARGKAARRKVAGERADPEASRCWNDHVLKLLEAYRIVFHVPLLFRSATKFSLSPPL